MSFQRLLITVGVAACAVLALAVTAPPVLPPDGSADGGEADNPRSGPTAPPRAGRTAAATAASGETITTATPANGLPGLGRRRTSDAPLAPEDLPRAATGRATLVAGYPSDVLPAAPGSRVSTNSVSPSGDRLQVALVASTGRGPDAVLRFYRTRLARLGLHEVSARPAAGSSAAAFVRGPSYVVVTATADAARTTTYSVFANLTSRGM